MNQPEFILVIDDDATLIQGLSMLLERDGRTVILCSDVESASLILDRYPITHVLCDVQFTGAFGFEGLSFVTATRLRMPDSRIVMMTGTFSNELEEEGRRRGADVLLGKPFTIAELEDALGTSASCVSTAYEIVNVTPVDAILRGPLNVAFQPIVRLDDPAAPFAYEALARIAGNWAGGGPAELFDYAERRGKLIELNLGAIRAAIIAAAELPEEALIFINVDASVFARHELLEVLGSASRSSGVELRRVVLELTERSALDADVLITPRFDDLHAAGIRIALDDYGSAHSHLSAAAILKPAFIKVGQEFGTDFELHPMKRRIVSHVAALARSFGAATILEGIETAATAAAAASLGIELAQGYHFGRPREVAHWRPVMHTPAGAMSAPAW